MKAPRLVAAGHGRVVFTCEVGVVLVARVAGNATRVLLPLPDVSRVVAVGAEPSVVMDDGEWRVYEDGWRVVDTSVFAVPELTQPPKVRMPRTLREPAPRDGSRQAPLVRCIALSSFGMGGGEDCVAGDELWLTAAHARELEGFGHVRVCRDAKKERERRQAELEARVESARRQANPLPAPAPPPYAPPQGEGSVLVRCLQSFCVAAGKDVAEGELIRMSIEDATRRVAIGFVEILPEPEPAEAEAK